MTIILTILETSSQTEDSEYHNYSTYELLSMFYNNFYFSSSYSSKVFQDTNYQIKHMIRLLEADIRNLTEINNLLEKTDSIE